MSNTVLEAKVEARTAELKLAKEHAEEASIAAPGRVAGQEPILAAMSHEIRTPLNGVVHDQSAPRYLAHPRATGLRANGSTQW
jgi:signal transduction histidine kinase